MSEGFRQFRAVNKVQESDVIASFYLEPTDGEPVWPVKPGQYLTLKVPTESGSVFKTYSVSSNPSETKFHRITVKREGRPENAQNLPDGVGSCWLHDVVEEGSELEIAAPRGSFVLNEDSPRPAILLSGGVGITPLLSMLHRLAETERDVYFLHACEDGNVHAMREEVREIAEKTGANIRAYFIYRNPTKADVTEKLFDAEGVIDKAFLQSILPIDSYDAYMCGPTPFMVAMYRLLMDLGVPKTQIAYEFFGKASSLEVLAKAPKKSESNAASKAPAIIQSLAFLTDPDARSVDEPTQDNKNISSTSGDIFFKKSKVNAQWDNATHSLLELAEDSGLSPDFSCRNGICNTCKVDLLEGEVEYFEHPLEKPEKGKVLICCSRPNGRIVLDI